MIIHQGKYIIVSNLREPDYFRPVYYWSLTVGTKERILLEETYPINFREEEILSLGLSFAHGFGGE
jgi:hypothetical protein